MIIYNNELITPGNGGHVAVFQKADGVFAHGDENRGGGEAGGGGGGTWEHWVLGHWKCYEVI